MAARRKAAPARVSITIAPILDTRTWVRLLRFDSSRPSVPVRSSPAIEADPIEMASPVRVTEPMNPNMTL